MILGVLLRAVLHLALLPRLLGFTWDQLYFACATQAAVMMLAFAIEGHPGFQLGTGFYLMLLAGGRARRRRGDAQSGRLHGVLTARPDPRNPSPAPAIRDVSLAAHSPGFGGDMDHTPVDEPVGPADDGPTVPATFWGRAVNRPRASFSDALAAGGGVIVTIGVLLIAADRYANSGDGWQGALVFVGLFLIANLALLVVREPFDAACTGAIVLSVPAVYGFLVFPSTDSFADVRLFLILTIVTWALLFAVSNSRGRPILLALAAVLLYLWIVGEVADLDAYSANPVPSPTFASPSALFDAVRGNEVEAASFHLQQVTLDDLDPTDPLYPLAVVCDSGDLTACDELWSQAEPGSDFESVRRVRARP